MYLYFIASTLSILIVFTDSDGFAMVIDFTFLIITEGVHVGVEQHHNKVPLILNTLWLFIALNGSLHMALYDFRWLPNKAA